MVGQSAWIDHQAQSYQTYNNKEVLTAFHSGRFTDITEILRQLRANIVTY